MDNEEHWYRNFFWWQTGVSPDNAADVGGRMIRAVIVWFAVLVFLVVLVAAVGAIT